MSDDQLDAVEELLSEYRACARYYVYEAGIDEEKELAEIEDNIAKFRKRIFT